MRNLAFAVCLLSFSPSLFSSDSDYAFTSRDGSAIEGKLNRGNRYIVEFITSGYAISSRSELLNRFERDVASVGNVAIRHRYRHVFSGASVEASPAEVAQIAALPYVKKVHRVERYRTMGVNGAPALAGKAPAEAGAPLNGAGVRVAIIDTGVDYLHESLGAGFGAGFKVIGGYDFVNNDADPMDDAGHGTHVAGIVAGQGQVQGVAPAARLVAFKVLGANGSGSGDDVVAAVERTVDVNGDGDRSDAVQVANMSLGSELGAPGDPVIIAVENAIRAGVVFAVAAGNSGDYWTVGSPASSPNAITVGAIDSQGRLAPFSSRGPGRGAYGVKPEVIAPGVQIISARVGGGVVSASGTSMASPYVAGVAAIVRSMHPEWTPAQVKSAIVNSAAETRFDIMAAGAGQVSRDAAVATQITAEPATVGFGLDDLAVEEWTPQRRVTLTNHSSSTVDLTVRVASAVTGVRFSGDPAALTLEAGESREVTVTLTATNADVAFPLLRSFAYGGTIEVSSADRTVRVPWAFLKAARATFRYGKLRPVVAATNERLIYGAFPNGVDEEVEVLLTPDKYDFLLYVEDFGAIAILREQETIERNHRFELAATDAPHVITFGADDNNGFLLNARERKIGVKAYDSRLRVVFPEGSALTNAELAAYGVTQIRLSPMSERFTLLGAETYANAETGEVYVVQHKPLRGASASTTLTRSTDLIERDVRILFPHGSTRNEILLGSKAQERFAGGYRWRATAGAFGKVDAPFWRGRIFITEDVDPRFSYAPFLTASNPFPWLDVPALHVTDRKVAAYDFLKPTPLTWASEEGQTMTFGDGPVRLQLSHFEIDGRLSAFLNTVGPLDERRNRDAANPATYAVHDSAGKIVAEGILNGPTFSASLPASGVYAIKTMQGGLHAAGERALATLTNTVDTRRPDSSPPMFTALRFADVDGASSSQLTNRGQMLLAVADYIVNPDDRTSQFDVAAAQELRAFVRRSGTESWTPLPLEQIGHDDVPPTESGHMPLGAMFRADFASLGAGLYDLKLTTKDSGGNATDYVLEPAFRAIGARRRVVSQ